MRNVLPSARSQRSFAKNPPPTSKRPPVSSHDSWHSHATRGDTYSGFKASMRFGGSTVSVMRDPAMGAMALTWMFFLRPSMARVFERPTRPSFAVA